MIDSLEFVLNILDTILSFLLLVYFFKGQRISQKKRMTTLFFLCAVLALQFASENYIITGFLLIHLQNWYIIYQTILQYILYFSFCILLSEETHSFHKNMFFWSFFLSNLFLLTNAYATTLLYFILPNPHSIVTERVLYFIFSFLLKILLIQCLVPFRERLKQNYIRRKSGPLLIFISLILILGSILISFMWKQLNYSLSKELQIIILIIFSILFFSVIYIFIFLENALSKEVEMTLLNQRYIGELKYLNSMKENQKKIDTQRHNLKNQYIYILSLLERPSPIHLEKVKEYLKSELEMIHSSEIFYTHNFSLNYLINEKARISELNDVRLIAEVLLPETTRLNQDIFVMILGNLLDNAIEAAIRNEKKEEKVVYFTIHSFDGKIKIELINKFDEKEKTTRIDRVANGLGLKNIRYYVKKNNGLYHQEISENNFQTTIIFLDSYKC